MISETYSEDVFIADYTNYVIKSGSESVLLYKGVVVGTKETGIIPSFVIHNDHRYLFEVVNNEHNPAVFKRADGSKVSQCECIIYSNRKALLQHVTDFWPILAEQVCWQHPCILQRA